jgi:palmitoyl-protein thioesterase
MRLHHLAAALAATIPSAVTFVILPDADIFAASIASPVDTLPSQPEPEQLVQIQTLTPNPSFHSHPLTSEDDDTPLPVIIWHGLGDSADAEGIQSIATLLQTIHPGTYVVAISLASSSTSTSSGSADRSASFFGNVTTQIAHVCDVLSNDKILRTAPAIDAVGFSQGGQFLRGYIERCGHFAPRVRSLITFGSQHNGIAEFQSCALTDWVCHSANALLKSSTVWSRFVQSRLVPAQYYRNLDDWENYLESSNFLADVNNEREVKSALYKENLMALDTFVMVLFGEDKTVVPRESGWFAEVNFTRADDGSGDQGERVVTPLRERRIYTEDWIGLRALDERGALVFEEVEGEHMQLDDQDLKRLFGRHFGPVRRARKDREEL